MNKKEFKETIEQLGKTAKKNNGKIHLENIARGFNYAVLEYSGLIPETLGLHHDRKAVWEIISPYLYPKQYRRVCMNLITPKNKFYEHELYTMLDANAAELKEEAYAEHEADGIMYKVINDAEFQEGLADIRNRPLSYYYEDLVSEIIDLYQLLHNFTPAPKIITDSIIEDLKAHALKVMGTYPFIEWSHYQPIYYEILENYTEPGVEIEPTMPLIPLAACKTDETLIATSKVFNKQLEIAAHGEQGISVNVAGKGLSKVLVNATICFDKESNIAYIGEERPTFFDIIVSNALGAMFRQSGTDKAITAAQIYRQVAGITDKGGKVNDKQFADVELSMERLRSMRGVIDFTEQAKKHTKLAIRGDAAILEDYLVSASRVFSASGGYIISSYLLKDMPLFFKYSQAINQVTSVDNELLSHEYTGEKGKRETLKRSELTLIINHWLIMQIEMMKSQRKAGKAYEGVRTYDTFFKRTEAPKPTHKTEMARIRAYFKFFLEKFKRHGYIQDYEASYTGRAMTGFKITLPPKQIESKPGSTD